MAIETKYYCDRCKKEVKSDDLHLLRVQVKFFPGAAQYATPAEAEWCRDCIVSTGLIKWEPATNSLVKPPVKEPSFEDKVRLLVLDLIQDDITEAAIEAVRDR
jgi:hypothetical protein